MDAIDERTQFASLINWFERERNVLINVFTVVPRAPPWRTPRESYMCGEPRTPEELNAPERFRRGRREPEKKADWMLVSARVVVSSVVGCELLCSSSRVQFSKWEKPADPMMQASFHSPLARAIHLFFRALSKLIKVKVR